MTGEQFGNENVDGFFFDDDWSATDTKKCIEDIGRLTVRDSHGRRGWTWIMACRKGTVRGD